MKNNELLFRIGAFLMIAVGAPTADNGHFALGISIAFAGLILAILAVEEMRNPKYVSRQFRSFVWRYLRIKI